MNADLISSQRTPIRDADPGTGARPPATPAPGTLATIHRAHAHLYASSFAGALERANEIITELLDLDELRQPDINGWLPCGCHVTDNDGHCAAAPRRLPSAS